MKRDRTTQVATTMQPHEDMLRNLEQRFRSRRRQRLGSSSPWTVLSLATTAVCLLSTTTAFVVPTSNGKTAELHLSTVQQELTADRSTSLRLNELPDVSSSDNNKSNLQVARRRRKRRVSPDTMVVVGSMEQPLKPQAPSRPTEQQQQQQQQRTTTIDTLTSSKTSKAATTTPSSRSSTMPRYRTDRHHDKRSRMLAHRTGTAVHRQRPVPQHHNDVLYKSTAAVPDSMLSFVREIHREDRITRQEEMELGTKTQEGVRLQSVYDQFQQTHGRAPTDDEWCAASGKINTEALTQAIDEGMQAKNRLVTSNLRMVQSVVNTYIRNGLGASYNAGDLMQEGIMALIRAAEKFEPHRGFKFSTYAMYWVRSSVKRSHIVQTRPMIPIPQRLFERNKQLLRMQEQMTDETGVPPTSQELGAAVGISAKQVETCFRAMGVHCGSIDQTLRNPQRPNSVLSATGLGDLIPDDESNRAEQELLREDLLTSLQKHLDPEQLELLLLRFGVATTDDHSVTLLGPTNGKLITVAELSRRLGMKPWKIRKSIEESLEKLQEAGIDEWKVFADELA